jgi:hypothetical protein
LIVVVLTADVGFHIAEGCQFLAYPAGPTLFAHGVVKDRRFYDKLIIPLSKMVQLAYNDTREGWGEEHICAYKFLALQYASGLRELLGGMHELSSLAL